MTTQLGWFRGLLYACMFTLLAGCQSIAKAPPADAAAEQIALAGINQFRVTGGLGVWTDSESISTRIDWQQANEDFNVLVSLPAGLSTVRVIQEGNSASLQQEGATPVTGRSASVLMQQALGLQVAVPMAQMAQWIKGLPGDRAEAVKYDSNGRLSAMEFVDDSATRWRAKVLKRTRFNDLSVPALISAQGGPYTVRLVLKDWSALELDGRRISDLGALESDSTQAGQSDKEGGGRLRVPGR